MNDTGHDSRNRALGIVLLAVGICQAMHADECSMVKTNKSCTLILDRQNPLAPPSIQMYPDQEITVSVKNPYYFERYFLDYSSGQLTPNPDVASSIINGLLPSLKNLNEFQGAMARVLPRVSVPAPPAPDCTVANINANIPTSAAGIPAVASLYVACLNDFALKAKAVYLKLEPAVAPDSHPQGPVVAIPSQSTLDTIANTDIPDLYSREAELSTVINSIEKNLDTISASGVPGLTPNQANMVRNWVALSALTDAIAKDLAAYAARISDLSKNPLNDRVTCSPGAGTCVSLTAIVDPSVNHSKMVVRQVTYNLDALNVIQNAQEGIPDPTKKRTIASVTVAFGEARWEASAGTLFSTLANRSFSISPVLTNGAVTNKQVTQSVLHPTVVPFAAANIRLSDDLKSPQWRSAVYWTFAVGINPNTVSTDFATGPSISWRGLMFSALWHVGHDVRLTQGLYTNQILDPSFSGSATTQNYWRFDRVALGISVRVPSLTGR